MFQKEIFSRYGRLVILVALLLATTQVTVYLNRQTDDKLLRNKEENTIFRLRQSLENSTDNKEGLNPYYKYWDYEIAYFSENYPKEEEELFQAKKVDLIKWKADFDALKDLVNSKFIDDYTMMGEVRARIEEHLVKAGDDKIYFRNLLSDIFTDNMEEGYFRNVILLMKDDQK